ncbi:hypothetical protein PIB30_004828 [Stylosanthes scabra]|uniref:Uncharacterized protein n=1 Tax=Stylosanthes scabra TaxID=79078 RepID=A0ABU6U5G7_9FABA|nr:hypothetical protein [Stylosanthes scabra]
MQHLVIQTLIFGVAYRRENGVGRSLPITFGFGGGKRGVLVPLFVCNYTWICNLPRQIGTDTSHRSPLGNLKEGFICPNIMMDRGRFGISKWSGGAMSKLIMVEGRDGYLLHGN